MNTGKKPAEMLLGRALKTRLDLLRPNNKETRERVVERQIEIYKGHPVEISIGDSILYRDFKNVQDPT